MEALALAREYHPIAVSLDVFLPDMLGWTVLNHLKQDPTTRHIPVQMLTLDEDRQQGLARGAFSFITKPTTPEGLSAAMGKIKAYSGPRRRRLLVVEDNDAERLTINALLGHDDIDIVTTATGSEALAALQNTSFDCMVLDLRLPDMSGFEVLAHVRDTPSLSELPVVVFTGKELSPEEDAQLHTLARSVVVKGVESPERLLDETALFLHRVIDNLPVEKQKMLDRLHRSDEMDGYETMQVIRENPSFRRLPIVALTAKAMKGDRERCLEAGASEYLAKPVNTEQLLSALRMWLHR